MLTMTQRIAAFRQTFAKWPASWPWLVAEQGRAVVYGVWVLGNDYRNKTAYYGAYPPGFLDRVMALFPDAAAHPMKPLHVFSGSLPHSEAYTTVDVNPACQPDIVASVYDLPRALTYGRRAPVQFPLVVADPPYTAEDAKRYGTPMVDRRRAIAALAKVTEPGGHLAWLDCVWPMHSKRQWVTVGRILVQRSTNHRVRLLSLFERVV